MGATCMRKKEDLVHTDGRLDTLRLGSCVPQHSQTGTHSPHEPPSPAPTPTCIVMVGVVRLPAPVSVV